MLVYAGLKHHDNFKWRSTEETKRSKIITMKLGDGNTDVYCIAINFFEGLNNLEI